MIYVLMTSELPWQRNDTITIFYLPLYFSVPGVSFFQKSIKGACTAPSYLDYG